jgi:hypothetical protein
MSVVVVREETTIVVMMQVILEEVVEIHGLVGEIAILLPVVVVAVARVIGMLERVELAELLLGIVPVEITLLPEILLLERPAILLVEFMDV